MWRRLRGRLKNGRVDKSYNLWSRNPIKVAAAYLSTRTAP